MSNDAMPCGCEGHLDNESLCKYPAVYSAYLAACKKNGRLQAEIERWRATFEDNRTQAYSVALERDRLREKLSHTLTKAETAAVYAIEDMEFIESGWGYMRHMDTSATRAALRDDVLARLRAALGEGKDV